MDLGSIGTWSGWLAAAVVVTAGTVPTAVRVLAGRRGSLESRPLRSHVVIGASAAALAFGHALAVLPSLGSPAAIAGGDWPLASGALAFLLLIAHVGVGNRLRDPKLKERQKVRRTHVAFATAILFAIGFHVFMLVRSS